MIKIIILFIFNKFANAFLFFLGNTPKSRHSRAVVNPNASARKPISRHSHVYPVIPTKVGIQFFEFQSFPINCLSIECLDSRLRGNDGISVCGLI